MTPSKSRQQIDLHEYGAYIAGKLAEAWDLAKRNVQKAQKQQKKTYDQHSRPPNFKVGERVFLFKPAERNGENRKLARAYHGPYQVIKLTTNNDNAHIRRVDKPEDESLLVAIDRLRRCPDKVADTFWPPDQSVKKQKRAAAARNQKTRQLRAAN